MLAGATIAPASELAVCKEDGAAIDCNEDAMASSSDSVKSLLAAPWPQQVGGGRGRASMCMRGREVDILGPSQSQPVAPVAPRNV